MSQLNPNFDWVTARANCSASEVFKTLETQVKSDVEKRNGLRTSEEMKFDIKFAIESSMQVFRVGVFRDSQRLNYSVFSQIPEGIKVEYKEREPLVGVLTLSNDGECRLRVKDVEEYAFWQFRKLALEPIFFGNNLGW
jgi:hypothetical protein